MILAFRFSPFLFALGFVPAVVILWVGFSADGTTNVLGAILFTLVVATAAGLLFTAFATG